MDLIKVKIMITDAEKLEAFEKQRLYEIELLDKGKIGKVEFLEENYNFLQALHLKPFSEISNLKEAIYNYQYYNIMAKRSNYLAYKCKGKAKKKKLYKKLISERESYYYQKDLATLRILELQEYKDIECYFIDLRSSRLTGKIFEIVCPNLDGVILHSKNEEILKRLYQENAFNNECKKSKIDDYVNRAY